MSQVFRDGDRLILEMAGPQAEPGRQRFDFQLLSPLLLGLLVPFIAASYFEPEALRHLKWPIWLLLVGLFAICSGLFFYTHHFPGKISSLVIDREARTIEIVWRNLLASASQIVPFNEISALRVRNDYDDDGYPVPVAELVIRSQGPIQLPDGITETQLRPLRAAIGLG